MLYCLCFAYRYPNAAGVLSPAGSGDKSFEQSGVRTCSSVRAIFSLQNSQVISRYLHLRDRWSAMSFLMIFSLHFPKGQGTSKYSHTFKCSWQMEGRERERSEEKHGTEKYIIAHVKPRLMSFSVRSRLYVAFFRSFYSTLSLSNTIIIRH